MRLILILCSFVCASRLTAADKPIPPKEAPSKMTVPPGFKVTLFAGEPGIVQPIAFTFDDRGRMWVVECLSYPKWRDDGKGNDRVVILEDTDGDGQFDKKTVVLDNGSNLSGIELGFGGVWLCSTPNLIFIPIKDDKPSGPPEVVLDGWNLKDAKHNVFNSLAWGPDGWLYGCNGIQTKSWIGKPGTPQKDRTYMDCGVWRYHPTRKVFEVFATGTTNPWGLDWDEHGELFITNCVIDHLWHVVPGGRYQRMYGQDPNPYAYGLMGSCVDYKHWGGGHWTEARADIKTGAVKQAHSDAGGGHAHVGCCIYLGENFPKEYRNTLFTCNLHGNRLNNDGLERTPTGMKGVRRPDFLFANDPWFRGICVKQGPEGALYVSDWCDTGECHNYEKVDPTNGRIYRVSYGEPKKFAGDVAKMKDEELVKAQFSKDEWMVRHARRVIQEHSVDVNRAGSIRAIIRDHDGTDNWDHFTLHKLWAVQASGGWSDKELVEFMQSLEDIVAAWAIRLATDRTVTSDLIVQGIQSRCSSIRPWLQPKLHTAIVTGLPRLPASTRDEIAWHYASNRTKKVIPFFSEQELKESLDSRNTKLNEQLWDTYRETDFSRLLWYAMEPLVAANPAEWIPRINSLDSKLLRQFATRRVLDVPANELPDRLKQVTAILAGTADDTIRIDILLGIRDALASVVAPKPPANWVDAFTKLTESKTEAVNNLADELGIKFGDERAMTMLAFAMNNEKLSPARRQRAIALLAPTKRPEMAEAFRHLLVDPKVRGAAIKALALYSDAEIPSAIMKHYSSFTAEEKADAVITLAGRKDGALALLAAVGDKRIPKSDVSAFAARQMKALNDKAISALLEDVWGTVKPASATRAAQTAKLKALLTPEYVKTADAANGKSVFTKTCASCHKLNGEGGDVGPDLTGSQRANLDYVLENVLDPSAVVPGEYKMTAFYLSDGRVVTGLLKKEAGQTVTVRTVNDTLQIPVKEIDSRKPTNLSLMPEGLLDAMKDEEIRDLIAYLAKK
jgi:putative membrane-bound dehydrogenase-like protein